MHKATPEQMALAKKIAEKLIDQASDPWLLLFACKIVEKYMTEFFEENGYKINKIVLTKVEETPKETPNEIITYHDA